MKVFLLEAGQRIPDNTTTSTAYLNIDNWNDYSFVTMFYLTIIDENGTECPIGNVKIGFSGQTPAVPTFKTLQESFDELPPKYFSLGMDVDYYRRLAARPLCIREGVLCSLHDIAYDQSYLETAKDEPVFSTSLLRNVSQSVIKGQYHRVLNGQPPLTDFRFAYYHPREETTAEIDIDFKVVAGSRPSTNIHAIIGRNGAGKTTLLNSMVKSIVDRDATSAYFYERSIIGSGELPADYFSSLVSISFSAFDSFTPPSEKSDPADGACFFYVGLKRAGESDSGLKSLPELHEEFVRSLTVCMSQEAKRARWLNVVTALESDANFAEMELLSLADVSRDKLTEHAASLIGRMSAGHTIVLLTVTKLAENVEEKTLVIIDEPESHLHAPLLSAFVRSLSQLLHDRNGVAIAATHSPVVLQEIPRECVWKIRRSRLQIDCRRPEYETFAENVGTLTRDVFGLEVEKSGFHGLLRQAVDRGLSFDEILAEYSGQIGYEGQAVLLALVAERDQEIQQ